MNNSSTVAMISLGCPKNLVNSEEMLALLQDAGYAFTDDLAKADAAIINTCAFIESAKTEAIEKILETEQPVNGIVRFRQLIERCVPQLAVNAAAVKLIADAALTVALGGIVPHNETGKALVVHNAETAQPIGDLFGVGVRYAFFRELIEQHSARYVAAFQNFQRPLPGFVVHQPSKSSAEISMARPAAMAALRACGVSSLWALARMSASILSATSGLDSRYSLTLSLP